MATIPYILVPSSHNKILVSRIEVGLVPKSSSFVTHDPSTVACILHQLDSSNFLPLDIWLVQKLVSVSEVSDFSKTFQFSSESEDVGSLGNSKGTVCNPAIKLHTNRYIWHESYRHAKCDGVVPYRTVRVCFEICSDLLASPWSNPKFSDNDGTALARRSSIGHSRNHNAKVLSSLHTWIIIGDS